jgi:predicted Zn-dependent peptidase
MSPVDRTRLPDIGEPVAFRFPHVARGATGGGTRLWHVAHRELPVVTFTLLLPAGSAADPPDRPGLAGLSADMLDEGSGSRTAIQIHEDLERIGARFDTEVGPDATSVTLTTLSRFADRGLHQLADIVLRPLLGDEDFTRVRELRLNRLLQLRDQPGAIADRVFMQALYGEDPYGHASLGTEHALRSATIDDVRAFHRDACRGVATLIAAGDIDEDVLGAMAASAFSGWSPEQGAPAGAPPASPPATEATVQFVHRAGAAQSELRVGHVACERRTPDYHALLVLNMILGGQFVSRINLNLREDKGFTYGARTSFDFRRRPGPFVAQTSVQTDATAAALREILAEIEMVRGERPPSSQELALARAALSRGYPRNFETAEQIARAATQLALYDLPDDSFEQFVPRVSAVDEDGVVRVARAWLRPARAAIVVVGDRDAVGSSLDALGRGPVVMVDPAAVL